MARNPEADLVAQLVSDPADADTVISVVGDQVITATPADVGKVVTVDSDGTLVLGAGGGDSIPTSEKGAPNGVATLDSGSKIPAAQIPALALSEFLGTVASEAAMLALSGQRGDWCVRTDLDPDRAFILESDDPTQAANWTDITGAGGGAVLSVDGQTGAVDLSGAYVATADGGLETVQAHGNTGATETIDLANGNVHTATQDQACTYTFTGATNGKACSFTLILASVSGAATWPASVNWPGGVAPSLSGRCVLVFSTTDGGTTWDGFLAGGAGSGVAAGTWLAGGSFTNGSDSLSAKSTTSTTFADVDATNLAATATFPASGRLRVVVQGVPHASGAQDVFWALRDGSGDIAGTQRFIGIPGSGAVTGHTTIEWIITGTPGASITVKWAWRTASGTIYLASGPNYGPNTIDVYAA